MALEMVWKTTKKYTFFLWLFVILLFGVAFFYHIFFPSIFEYFSDFYTSKNSWRQSYLDTRIYGYRPMLFALALAALIWALLIAYRHSLLRIFTPIDIFFSKRKNFILIFLGLILCVLAFYFSQREWIRFGKPCWNNYCIYADLIRAALFENDPGARESLKRFLEIEYHANSPGVPFLTASISILSGSTSIVAFRILCSLCTIISFVFIWRFVRRFTEFSSNNYFPTLFLLGSNFVIVRSSSFPQTDAAIFLWITASLYFARKYLEHRNWRNSIMCFILLVSGLFIKLSFLPALTLIPLWSLIYDYPRCSIKTSKKSKSWSWKKAILQLVKEGLLYSLLPLCIYLLWQYKVGTLHHYKTEFGLMQTEDTYLSAHIVCLLQSGLFFYFLILYGVKRLGKTECLLICWGILYWLSLIFSGASGWSRFYLGILPTLGIVSGVGLECLRENLGKTYLWIYCIISAVLSYTALSLNLYY